MPRVHLVLLALLALLFAAARTQPSTNMMNWVVDLDLPPDQRWPWNEMASVYGSSVLAAQALIKEFLPAALEGAVEKLAVDFIDRLGPYGLEIQACAAEFNFSLGAAVLLNYIYEVEAGCTSIIARTPAGEILHGRNLDFNLASVLQNLTCQVTFTKSNQTLYTAVTYAGYVGVLTGVRNGAFSISVDQRQAGFVLENLMELLLNRNSTADSILVREMMENAHTFDEAVAGLTERPIIAPVYYIVGGLNGNQGAVITRDRNSTVNVWNMNETEWYLVETNYDHWLPDPAKDDRRTLAENALDQIGDANINLSTLFSVLSVPRVLNGGTTYTALMVPTNGTMIAIRR